MKEYKDMDMMLDEELDGVAGGAKVCYFSKPYMDADGTEKIGFIAGDYDGDANDLKKMFHITSYDSALQQAQKADMVGGEFSASKLENNIAKMKKRGYTVIQA